MRRFDVQRIDGYEVTSAGFIRVPVFTGRTGVQNYQRRKTDGSGFEVVREYRPPEEVFSKRTMDSIRNLPVTNERGSHPQNMVGPDNAKQLMAGMTVDAEAEVVDKKYQKTYAIIYDAAAIERVKSGKLEVSLGYDVDVEFTAGTTPDGEKYDAIQRNIVNNHLALVDRARGGREIRLRLDGQDAVLVNDGDNHEEDPMKYEITIAGKKYEVSKEAFDAWEAAEKVRSDAEKAAGEKLKTAEASVTTLTKEKEGLQGKVDSLTDELKTAKAGKQDGDKKLDQSQIDAAVVERRKVERVAEKTLSKDELAKLDGLKNGEIKKLVIKSRSKDANLDGKSDDYVNARFDHIAESLDATDKNRGDAGDRVIDMRRKAKDESEMTDAEKAREKSQKEDADAWKKPLGKKAD